MKRALTVLTILCAIDVAASQPQPQRARIHHVEELRWPQIDALDRDRTMFLLTVGMLEEHGPHLPIGADTFGVSFETNGVAERVAGSLPQWNVVMMPPINYGQGGANQIGGRLVHPGTYGVRQSTIRSLVADVGAQIALNRFKWIFVLNGHGAPTHHLAINEACDFVSERYAVNMLHISGLFGADAQIQSEGRKMATRFFSPQEVTSFGLDVHAGVNETSAMLALRSDLVDGGYKNLPALAGHTREELQAIAKRPGWSGYLSAPARASAAHGRAVEEWWVQGLSDLILRAVGGQDLSKAPRAPDRIDAATASILGPALEDEQVFEAALQEWLSRRPPH
jgi:creatinine amidohydrolase